MYYRRSGHVRRCGTGFRSGDNHIPTPAGQHIDDTQLGPRRRRRGVCRRSLSGEPDVENVDVAEILLQDGGHTMPTTGLGRPAVSVAVVPRSLSATHVWIESASQRRHSAESRSGASQVLRLPFGVCKRLRDKTALGMRDAGPDIQFRLRHSERVRHSCVSDSYIRPDTHAHDRPRPFPP